VDIDGYCDHQKCLVICFIKTCICIRVLSQINVKYYEKKLKDLKKLWFLPDALRKGASGGLWAWRRSI
jgi:hypothetical protein